MEKEKNNSYVIEFIFCLNDVNTLSKTFRIFSSSNITSTEEFVEAVRKNPKEILSFNKDIISEEELNFVCDSLESITNTNLCIYEFSDAVNENPSVKLQIKPGCVLDIYRFKHFVVV
jgi:hypothetical protein